MLFQLQSIVEHPYFMTTRDLSIAISIKNLCTSCYRLSDVRTFCLVPHDFVRVGRYTCVRSWKPTTLIPLWAAQEKSGATNSIRTSDAVASRKRPPRVSQRRTRAHHFGEGRWHRRSAHGRAVSHEAHQDQIGDNNCVDLPETDYFFKAHMVITVSDFRTSRDGYTEFAWRTRG